jgi:hypothetical protein
MLIATLNYKTKTSATMSQCISLLKLLTKEVIMCDEYTDSKNDKVIKLTEKEYNELWWDMQWPEDKARMLEQEKQLNGLVNWLGI